MVDQSVTSPESPCCFAVACYPHCCKDLQSHFNKHIKNKQQVDGGNANNVFLIKESVLFPRVQGVPWHHVLRWRGSILWKPECWIHYYPRRDFSLYGGNDKYKVNV